MIDKGLGEWPPEIVAAAQKFQQGDLLAAPALGYAASLEYPVWALTRQEAEASEPDDEPVHLALDPVDRPPFGIITSQTCDVAEDRPVPVQPWIDVSPVFLVDDNDPLLWCDYVYPLPDYPAPEGKCYLADLRLNAPLEKGLLVGREPIDPFDGSEQKRIAFGDYLGKRHARAALAESIHTFVSETLRKHKRKTGDRVKTRLHKLMLQIQEGERLNPRAVRLHVITIDSEGAKIDLDELKEWFRSWCEAAREVAAEHGVNLLDSRFHDGARMDVRL